MNGDLLNDEIARLRGRLAQYEKPTSKYVEVSRELIDIMTYDWSEPVCVKIEQAEGSLLRLVFMHPAKRPATGEGSATPTERDHA